MAVCNTNELLEDGRCFAALPPFIQQAAALALWCNISAAITPSGPEGGVFNPDTGGPIFGPDIPGPIVNPDI
jgi:hypothetical protein